MSPQNIKTTSNDLRNLAKNGLMCGGYDRSALIRCSSHSVSRTLIKEVSTKILMVGGQLRDIQMMVGHASL